MISTLLQPHCKAKRDQQDLVLEVNVTLAYEPHCHPATAVLYRLLNFFGVQYTVTISLRELRHSTHSHTHTHICLISLGPVEPGKYI